MRRCTGGIANLVAWAGRRGASHYIPDKRIYDVLDYFRNNGCAMLVCASIICLNKPRPRVWSRGVDSRIQPRNLASDPLADQTRGRRLVQKQMIDAQNSIAHPIVSE